jgi:hypothetical protein
MADKQFIGIVKTIPTQYGDLVKVSISREDFEKNQVNGWVNAVFKTSKSGKKYLEVDTWKPKPKENPPASYRHDDTDLPF